MGLVKLIFYPGLGCFLGYALQDSTFNIYRKHIVDPFKKESAKSSSLEASTILFSGAYDAVSEFWKTSRENRAVAKELEIQSKHVKEELKFASQKKDEIVNKAKELKVSLTEKKDQSDRKQNTSAPEQQALDKGKTSSK